MNKNKILIIILTVILIVCGIILGILKSMGNKYENKDITTLLLTCDSKNIKLDKEINCTLNGVSKKYDVSAVSATIENSLDFELVNVITNNEFEGDGEFGDVDLYTDVNKKNEFDILTFTIKLINDNVDSIDINIVDNSFFDENYKEHTLQNVKETLKVVR